MQRVVTVFVVLFALSTWMAGRGAQEPAQAGAAENHPQSNPDRDKEAGESSSRDTRIDTTPPPDDAKNHPDSAAAVAEATGEDSSGVQEFQPWNPHKALKDIEIGDYYFKRKNYRAALDRYREALVYKPNDAIANFRLAECFEQMNDPGQAVTHYHEYLKILPNGPLSKEATKALAKLEKPQTGQAAGNSAKQ